MSRDYRGGGQRENSSFHERGGRQSQAQHVAFVGNLPQGTVQGDLSRLFDGLKTQSIRLLYDKETKRFRGFGFVQFDDEETLHQALKYDGSLLGGNYVKVNIAAGRKEHGDTGQGGQSNYEQKLQFQNGFEPPAAQTCSPSPSANCIATPKHQFDSDEWNLTVSKPCQQSLLAPKMEDEEIDWADPVTDGESVLQSRGRPAGHSDESESSDDGFGVPISSYRKAAAMRTPLKTVFPDIVAKENTSGLTSKARRSQQFHKSQNIARANRAKMNATRPQSIYTHFLRRARLINSGLLTFTYHPFNKMVREWIPPDSVLQPLGNWLVYENSGGKPNPKWISTRLELDEMTKQLLTCERIGFDLEGHCDDTKYGYVALLQLSSEEFGDFLVDAISLQKEIATVMKPIFESLSPLKVMFDVSNDVRNLQKEFDIFTVGVIDLQVLYSIGKNCSNVSLKNLMKAFYPDDTSLDTSEETLSDWSMRPLSKEQLKYATNDCHYLLKIYDQMLFTLHKEGTWGQQVLMKGFEESKTKSLVLWDNPSARREDFVEMTASALYEHNKNNANSRSDLTATDKKLNHLVEWRHRMSNVLDMKDNDVLSTYKLLQLHRLIKPTLKDIENVLGKQGQKLRSLTKQDQIILDLLENGDDFMDKWRNLVCHNCVKAGHGAVWACPFPPNKHRNKEFYELPGKQQIRTEKRKRRRRVEAMKRMVERQKEQEKVQPRKKYMSFKRY